MRLFNHLCFSIFAAASLSLPALAQADGAPTLQRFKNFHFGDDAAILDTISQWARESRATPDRRREAARELAAVLNASASFEAKQFACRELVLIAGEEQVPSLVGLLPDDRLAHYATMVLARIPGPVVDEALRRELSVDRGRPQIEIINAIGERRDVGAIRLLTTRLATSDAATQDAAAAALGKMGDSRALQALRDAYAQAAGERRPSYGRALLDCAERLRAAGNAQSSPAIYELLLRKPASPQLSAGALRGLVLSGGPNALPQLLDALEKEASPLQWMALGLARELPGRTVTQRLSERLPRLSVAGQLLLLEVLRDRGDAVALPAVVALSQSPTSVLRTAAINALGILGNASLIPHLLKMTTFGKPEQDAARASLTRLRGPSIDAKLLALLDAATAPTRVEIIDVLGRRRVLAAVPRLVQEVRSRQPGVGAAAVRVLRDMGRPADLPTLLAALPTTTSGERGALIGAITTIAQRGANEAERTNAVLAKLSKSSTPNERAELFTILGQIGGPKALQALRKAVSDPAPEVQQSTLRRLAEWPTDAPMSDLLRLSRTAPDEKQRAIAVRGYIRMIGLSEERTAEQMLALYREATSLSANADVKRLVLAGVAKHPSLDALEYASQFLGDKEVQAEAELAAVDIGRSTAGTWRDRTQAVLQPIAQNSTNENARNGAREVLARIEKFADFITAWEVSPAYQREGATCAQLFDITFAPEEPQSAAKVLWRLMPAGTNAEQPWLLDLLALWGGEQRVAYLRTSVWSEDAREAVLELGSDDGTKAWWNGNVVLSENVQRAVAPGQNKVRLQTKVGWNQLMLKVTQNVMGWGACARFTNADGSPINGLRYAVPSSIAEGALRR